MKLPDVSLEKYYWGKGIDLIAGIDEVGRGPWAGPVVAGAVMIIDESQCVDGVRDSKKLTKRKRNDLSYAIIEASQGYGLGIVNEIEIESIGIANAVKKAMELATINLENKLGKTMQFLLIDGENVKTPSNYKCLKENFGDNLHYSIAASSIVAKVARDKIMEDYAEDFPEYGFELNSGYGTKKHRDALVEYGICKIHRKTYKPIKKLIEETTIEKKKDWRYWRGDCV